MIGVHLTVWRAGHLTVWQAGLFSTAKAALKEGYIKVCFIRDSTILVQRRLRGIGSVSELESFIGHPVLNFMISRFAGQVQRVFIICGIMT